MFSSSLDIRENVAGTIHRGLLFGDDLARLNIGGAGKVSLVKALGFVA